MKKFLTGFAVCALAAATALSFSACGGNTDDEEKTVYTVTEAEWKSAISVFCPDDEELNGFVRTNFTCTMKGEMDEGEKKSELNSFINCDYNNKAFRIEYDFNYGSEENAYFWEDNGVYGGYPDDGYKILHESENKFDEYIISNIAQFAGTKSLFECSVKTSFSSFVYDESTKSYKATLAVGDEEVPAELKFENGKLVAYNTDYFDAALEYVYEYGTQCVVPDEVKNLPLKQD